MIISVLISLRIYIKEDTCIMNTTQQTTLNGTPCIMLQAGGYEAYIAYEIGSNVIRLRDVRNQIDVFRFSPDNTPETLLQSAEIGRAHV